MGEPDLMQRLDESVKRQPFAPFDLRLPDGTLVTIDSPQAIAFRAGMAVYLGPDRTCTLFDHEEMRRFTLAVEHPPATGSRGVTAGWLTAFLLGICGAVIAATADIESIVGTGPAFSALGLVVAERGRRHRLRGMFWTGLSTLILSLFVFGLINVAEWSPDQARIPVAILLMIYQMVVIPAGLITLWKLFDTGPTDRAWQFDLRSLLGLICLIAVSLAAARVANNQGVTPQTAAAIALATATLCGLSVICLAVRSRHRPG